MARILTRTHYQVDEPAYLRVLIRECTSPTRSEYPERVALRLSTRLKEMGIDFNAAAAKYCVDLAMATELLTTNSFWTGTGHTLNLISPPANTAESAPLRQELSVDEQIFFFRLFLESDGAALIFFAKLAKDGLPIPAPESDWNSVADALMEFAYESYLAISTDFRERSKIREVLARRSRKPYSGKSGTHQCFLHLQTMHRIGFLEAGEGRRTYLARSGSEEGNRIRHFLEIVPDAASLEKIIAAHAWPGIAAKLFFDRSNNVPMLTDDEIVEGIRRTYSQVAASGVSLCPLQTAIETSQIQQIAAGRLPRSREDVLTALRDLQRRAPKSIRFHVDRLGRPAFVTFA